MNYDARKVTYQEVTIFDRPALFTECRIDRTTVPEGVYRYELRHGDENWGEPVELARSIFANYYGTVLTREPFQLPVDGWIPMENDSLSFLDGECRTLSEFQQKYPTSEKDVIDFYSVNDPALHNLYFSRSEEQDKVVGCVGHLRGDFGSGTAGRTRSTTGVCLCRCVSFRTNGRMWPSRRAIRRFWLPAAATILG